MNTVKRVCCQLPILSKSLCETGCVYREPAFRHLACKQALKTECAAPCYPEPCPCSPKTDSKAKGKTTYKYYHEVFAHQEETSTRSQLSMHM
jgi:hypothetical protein